LTPITLLATASDETLKRELADELNFFIFNPHNHHEWRTSNFIAGHFDGQSARWQTGR
jgi:hypothetical protein